VHTPERTGPTFIADPIGLQAIWVALDELRSASPKELERLRSLMLHSDPGQPLPVVVVAETVDRETGMHGVAQLMRSPMGMLLIGALLTALRTLGGDLTKEYLDQVLHLTPPPTVVKVELPRDAG
jgi:hypothetical protein